MNHPRRNFVARVVLPTPPFSLRMAIIIADSNIVLYTIGKDEDLQHGQVLENRLPVINPFLAETAA